MYWSIVNDRQQNIAPGLQILLVIATAFVTLSSANAQTSEDDVEGERFFYERIEPLLKAHCLECHSHAAEEMAGGLTLDSRNGWAEGGGRGAAIVPGKPEDSLLIKAIRRDDSKLQMPPDEKLSDDVIADIEHWIKKGAPDPREGAATIAGPAFDLQQARKYWAFQPIRDHEIPTVQNVGWLQTAVDNFVLA